MSSAVCPFVTFCMCKHDLTSSYNFSKGNFKLDLAISQSPQYNCFANYKEGTNTHRQRNEPETPFTVYLALSVFTKTRKRRIIDMLHENGLRVLYDTILEISAKLGEAVAYQYVEDGVVCPPALGTKLFTTSAVDNIDHNPSTTTAKISFHGTSISIFQHPIPDYVGELREAPRINDDISKVTRAPELPESLTNVRTAHISKNPTRPKEVSLTLPSPNSIHTFKRRICLVGTENVTDAVSITWAVHHARQKRGKPFEVSISLLLLLIRDQAHSVATIKHDMKRIDSSTVAFLNTGQTPVLAADQPLYMRLQSKFSGIGLTMERTNSLSCSDDSI